MEHTHRFLVSYHYMRGPSLPEFLDKHFGPERATLDLFIDSGAFSAMTQGAQLDVHEYGRYLRDSHQLVSVVANLDVIGSDRASAEATWRNWRTLRDTYGVPALPVVHVGEPFEFFDRYLEAGQDYIAIGGLVGKSWPKVLPWVVQAFRHVGANAVFHGFGLTSERPVADLPWYSVDSTSWIGAVRYGRLMLHDGRRLRTFVVSDRVQGAPNTSRTLEFNRLARAHGFEPEALRSPDGRLDNDTLTRASLEAWWRLEQQQRARHGLKARPAHPDAPLGLRLYLACSSWPVLKAARSHQPGRTTP